MKPETQERVSKVLFLGGFAFLPWLWIANYLLFRPYLERRSTPPGVKRYARASLWLGLVGFTLLLFWYIFFLATRRPLGLGWLTFAEPKSCAIFSAC